MEDAEGKTEEVNTFLKRLFESKLEIAPFHRRADVTIRVQEFLKEDIDKGVFLKLYVPNNRYRHGGLGDCKGIL